MPFTVREVQPTPNPNAIKFVLDGDIAPERLSFTSPPAADEHLLASRLFAIAGVQSLLLLGDFVTVVKSPDVKWGHITPKVKKVLTTG